MILSCQKETIPSLNISKTELTVSDGSGSQYISFDSNVSSNN